MQPGRLTTRHSLIEAACCDVSAAIKFERSLKVFGECFKCQGFGQISNEKMKRAYQQEKRKGMILHFEN